MCYVIDVDKGGTGSEPATPMEERKGRRRKKFEGTTDSGGGSLGGKIRSCRTGRRARGGVREGGYGLLKVTPLYVGPGYRIAAGKQGRRVSKLARSGAQHRQKPPCITKGRVRE